MDIRGFEVLRDNLKANLKPQGHLWISVLFVDIRGFEVLRDNLKRISTLKKLVTIQH